MVTLREAFPEPKTDPIIFTASASNSRRFLNAVRSAWYLMNRRDITPAEVNDIARAIRTSAPGLSKNIDVMFHNMLAERMEPNGDIVNVGLQHSDLSKVLFAAKHVLVAESQNDGRDGEPWIPPTFLIWYRPGGWPIGFLGWIEGNRFHGASCYGPNDFPFDGRTFEELAHNALTEEVYSLSMY